MKINDVIDQINQELANKRKILNKDEHSHIEVFASWERKMGTLKEATTRLYWVSPDKGISLIKEISVGGQVYNGEEQTLIEESNKKAIGYLVKLMLTSSEALVNGTIMELLND